MATTSTTQIEQLYVAYFHRPADAAGLAYWQAALEKTGSTAAMSAAFAASTEYQDGFAKLSTDAVINQIYQNLFGRAAETVGLSYWSSLLSSRALSIDNIVKNIADGARGSDLTAFNNKVKGASAFTAALDTTQEIAAYQGGPANLFGKAFIKGITTDASLASALLKDNLDAAIASIWAPARGDTLSLGADKLTSNAPNTHFSAPLGTTGNTLQNGDSITGSAASGDRLDARLGNLDNVAVAIVASGVETISIEAVARTPLFFNEQPAVTVNAEGVVGATTWVSDNSGVDLVIDNVGILPGQRSADISLVMRGTSFASTDFSVYFQNAQVPAGMASATIVLDNVGRGSVGGNLVVGTHDPHGIDRFEIEVGDSSILQTIRSSADSLKEVVLKNGETGVPGAVGNLQVRGLLTSISSLSPPSSASSASSHEEQSALVDTTDIRSAYFGFYNVRVIDASAMQGDFMFTSLISASGIPKYAGSGTPEYVYSGGAGNDSLHIRIDSEVLGSATRFTANGGAGNDIIAIAEGSFGTIWPQLGEVRLVGGDGDDAIHTGIRAVIDGGGGDDSITLLSLESDRLLFAPGFGNDKVTGLVLGKVAGADLLDFSALGGRGSAFAGSVISNADQSITVQRASAANDSAAEIAALYSDGVGGSTHVFLAYDSKATAQVYSVTDGPASAVVATLVGSISLLQLQLAPGGGNDWDLIGAANFM